MRKSSKSPAAWVVQCDRRYRLGEHRRTGGKTVSFIGSFSPLGGDRIRPLPE